MLKNTSVYLLPEGWFGNGEFFEFPQGSVSADAPTRFFVTAFDSSY